MLERHEVIFKGTREGLTIILPEGTSPERLMELLREKLTSANGFFNGATAILDLGRLELEEDSLSQLVSLIEGYGIRLVKITGASAPKGHLEASPGDAPAYEARGGKPGISPENTLLVKRTLRSGQEVSYPGNVVIVGDVNAGAEVVAGGDVVVMGALRGVAHAGVPDNREACVIALRLSPTQLRIADIIARSPDGSRMKFEAFLPETAYVSGNSIVIEPGPIQARLGPGGIWRGE